MKINIKYIYVLVMGVLSSCVAHGAADMLRVTVTTRHSKTLCMVNQQATFNDLLAQAQEKFGHPLPDTRRRWKPELTVMQINGRNVDSQFDACARLSDYGIIDGALIRVNFKYVPRRAPVCGVQ
jgi:hypothetical protein